MLGAALIAGVICVLIALILRERIALHYLLYLISLCAVVLAWEGYGHIYI